MLISLAAAAIAFAKPMPVMTMTLSVGQNTALTQPKKIVRALSGQPAIVAIMPFGKAAPTVGLMARGKGVTNVLVWTTDSQVHTYRITVK